MDSVHQLWSFHFRWVRSPLGLEVRTCDGPWLKSTIGKIRGETMIDGNSLSATVRWCFSEKKKDIVKRWLIFVWRPTHPAVCYQLIRKKWNNWWFSKRFPKILVNTCLQWEMMKIKSIMKGSRNFQRGLMSWILKVRIMKRKKKLSNSDECMKEISGKKSGKIPLISLYLHPREKHARRTKHQK